MNWDDLRFFLAVAAAGSLSGAAQQLGVNTSTVLRRVSSLEEDLDARLFDRERTGYRLTAAGGRLMAALEPVDQRLSSLARDFAASQAGAQGVVRLAAGETLAAVLIGAAMPALHSAHPDIELEILTDPTLAGMPGSAPRIANPLRDVDMALRAARPTQGDMLVRKLGDMAYGLYGSAAYFEAHGRPADINDLAGHHMIGFGAAELPLGPVWWMSRAEKSAEVIFRSSSAATRAEGVRRGAGLAALPCILADRDPALVRVFEPETVGGLELWLIARNDLAHLAHVRAVMDFLVEAVKARKAALGGQRHEVMELPRNPPLAE